MDPYEDTGHEIHPFDMTEEDEDEGEELPARVKYAFILQEEAFEDEEDFFRHLK
jgi:hypothetical protein